jgi:protein arginine N-methyltransferase 1
MRIDDYQESGSFTIDVAGQQYCVPRFCPHRGGRLADGYINASRKTIACPLHHSVFSLETGDQLAGPACGRLCVKKLGASTNHVNGEQRAEEDGPER